MNLRPLDHKSITMVPNAASDWPTEAGRFKSCLQPRSPADTSPHGQLNRGNLVRSLATAVALVLGAWASVATAAPADQNWPQWRGPLANGIAPAGSPPVSWSETDNVKWKIELPGNGTATPIIWQNQIFIQTAIATAKKAEPATEAAPAPANSPAQNPAGRRPGGRGGGQKPSEVHQFVILCLDRQTGKIIWQKVAREELPHEGHHPDHGFSSNSPITDGTHVFAYFGSRGLHCYDMNGNLRWQKDLGRMQTKMGFGEGSSPALHGKTLVVNWDHEGEDFIVAFDKDTGAELWRQSRDEETSWSTPFFVSHRDRTEVVVSASRKVRSYDLASGKVLWEASGLGANAIPTPVLGDGLLYAMTGYTRPALIAIRLGGSGDITDTDSIAWKLNKSTPYVASPLLYGNLLYFFSNRNGVLSCFDAKTGKPHFQEERLEALSGGVYASPVGAAGRIYLVGRNGTSLVIKQSEKLEILATNKLDDGIDASPAIVGQELFLRGRKYLYCISEK